MEQLSANRCFGGVQRVVKHHSAVLGCEMRLGIYEPPEPRNAPVVLFLSGLTCTEQNVITKGGLQRAASELGLILIAPDTSPRGEDVADDEGWDLGQGAAFYLTATQAPWSAHYRMDRYILEEVLPHAQTLTEHPGRGITGHSMGGHGAITLALRNPGVFRSVSAFAPILQPSRVPWGIKAFSAYLGEDRESWRAYDAEHLIASATEKLPILIDQGGADGFLDVQLGSDHFLAAAKAQGHPVTYRRQEGYDHSYYFVSTFAPEHLRWHAERM